MSEQMNLDQQALEAARDEIAEFLREEYGHHHHDSAEACMKIVRDHLSTASTGAGEVVEQNLRDILDEDFDTPDGKPREFVVNSVNNALDHITTLTREGLRMSRKPKPKPHKGAPPPPPLRNDAVNHPPHYNAHPSGVECIQVIEHMPFNVGNAIKYLWRADHKGAPIEDLEKARWYIDREITRRKASQ